MTRPEHRPLASIFRDVVAGGPAVVVALAFFSCHNGERTPSRAKPTPLYGRQVAFGNQPSAEPGGGDQTPNSLPLGQVAPLGVVVSDPARAEDILAGALGGGVVTLGLPSGGDGEVIERRIDEAARTAARGMTPVGEVMFAQLTTDGHARGALTMQPGACYTVVGFGASGVLEFQVNVLTSPPIPPQILAQSVPADATAVVGGDDQCIRSRYATPFDVGIDLHVVRGQGAVGARVYAK